jgi:hypothetical protein
VASAPPEEPTVPVAAPTPSPAIGTIYVDEPTVVLLSKDILLRRSI